MDKGRIGKYSAAVGALATTLRLYSDYKTKWDEKRRHTLTIEEGSYLYFPMMKWLSLNVPEAKHFKVIADAQGQTLIQNMRSTLRFEVEGHPIKMEQPEEKPTVEANIHGELDVKKQSCTFSASSREGIEALSQLLESLRIEKSKRNHEVGGYTASSYGWTRRDLPMRYLDKIFLPRGIKEALMSDIERFRGDEDKYATIGAPWHRGYLLYGPPGNGKTSLVQGLAHYYGMDVYNMPLSAITSDAQLMERMSAIDKNTILLVEDIDIFKNSVKRGTEKPSGPTLAGLLNAFDGINTPHGLITFFTTNEKDTLDPALVRDGRMDMHIELREPERYQIEAMFEAVYEEPLDVEPKQFKNMAQFANVLKRNLDNPEAARLEIKSE